MSERRQKERAERERRIVAAARAIAAGEGWDAVTIRRLSDEIGYSQPVLYTHYAGRAAIVGAVALDGFREIAQLLRDARGKAADPAGALGRVAAAYLSFAAGQPALYDAMFALSTDLRFGEADADPALREAFDALAAAVAPFAAEVDDATEFAWAALHGLAALERAGRIRPAARDRRVALLVAALAGRPPTP